MVWPECNKRGRRRENRARCARLFWAARLRPIGRPTRHGDIVASMREPTGKDVGRRTPAPTTSCRFTGPIDCRRRIGRSFGFGTSKRRAIPLRSDRIDLTGKRRRMSAVSSGEPDCAQPPGNGKGAARRPLPLYASDEAVSLPGWGAAASPASALARRGRPRGVRGARARRRGFTSGVSSPAAGASAP